MIKVIKVKVIKVKVIKVKVIKAKVVKVKVIKLINQNKVLKVPLSTLKYLIYP